MNNTHEGVGYGRPPRQYQFQKGKSGNPAGRPKRQMTFAECVYQELNGVLLLTADGRKQKKTRREWLAKQLVNLGLKGSISATKECIKQESSLMGDQYQDFEVTVSFPEEEERLKLQNRSY
jgi:hypothetical protein